MDKKLLDALIHYINLRANYAAGEGDIEELLLAMQAVEEANEPSSAD